MEANMEANIEGIRRIQELERTILREFIRICSKHHLRYFMTEGSLLGAIRHDGMIPWDDDIDVAMFREDYERFMQVAPAELGGQYAICHHTLREDYIELMTKIIDKRYFVRSSVKGEPFVTNVWIDIFVIDGMPKGKIAAKLRRAHLLCTKLMLMWSDVDHYAQPRKRPGYEKLLIEMARKLHFNRFINTKAWLSRLDRAMAAVPAGEGRDTVIFASEYRFRSVFPYEFYGEGREILFDGIPVRIPLRAEAILSGVYGDYMKLPPAEGRYKHKLELLSAQENEKAG